MAQDTFRASRQNTLYAQLFFIMRSVNCEQTAVAQLQIKNHGMNAFSIEELDFKGYANSGVDTGNYNIASANKIQFADALLVDGGATVTQEVEITFGFGELNEATIFAFVKGKNIGHKDLEHVLPCGLQNKDNLIKANQPRLQKIYKKKLQNQLKEESQGTA